jgi:hypothetical protein
MRIRLAEQLDREIGIAGAQLAEYGEHGCAGLVEACQQRGLIITPDEHAANATSARELAGVGQTARSWTTAPSASTSANVKAAISLNA